MSGVLNCVFIISSLFFFGQVILMEFICFCLLTRSVVFYNYHCAEGNWERELRE